MTAAAARKDYQNPELKEDLVKALEKRGGIIKGKSIEKIECPQCREKKGYSYVDNPFAIYCNRQDKCKAITRMEELEPDLFSNFVERYPSTKENPNASVEAYLSSRRLQLNQLNYQQQTWIEYEKKADGRWQEIWRCEAVAIRCDWTEDCWWLRLINPPKNIKDKNRWTGKDRGYQGQAWINRKQIDSSAELWLTEAIFDTVSLEQAGIQSACCFSCSHIPTEFLASLEKSQPIVIALDGDTAGEDGTHSLLQWLEENEFTNVTAAQPPRCLDWNDALRRGLLEEDKIAETLEKAKWRGRLLTSKNVAEYRETYEEQYHGNDGHYHGLLEFRGATYHCTTKSEGSGDNRQPVPLTELLLNARIERAFTRIKEERRFNAEHKDFIKITKAGSKQSRIIELAAGELVNGSKLKEALKAKANVLLLENLPKFINAIATKLERDKAPNVRQVERLGYDEQSKCYTFKNFLYDENGERHQVNAEGFFEKQGLVCETDEDLIEQFEAVDLKAVIKLIRQVYGNRGLMTLAFYVATLFKSEFLQRKGAFPYLSVSGLKGSGKTTLIDFCNHAFFQLWTGINASRSSTFKGLSRMLYHRHSLVIPYNESNGEVIGLDENQLLTGYHGGSLYVRAALSNDSSIINLPFNASLVFVQNIEPFSIGAVKERVISLRFQNAAEGAVTDESRAAMKELTALSTAQRAGIGHFILSNFKSIREQIFTDLDDTESGFATELESPRVAFTHAVLMSTCQALLQAARFETKEISEMKLAEEILNLAKTKDKQSGGENDVASTFMENFEQLRTKGVHDSKDNFHQLVLGEHYVMDEEFYWIRLGETERVMKEAGYPPLPKLSEKIKAADSLFVSEERKRRGWSEDKAQRSFMIRRIQLEEITSEPEVN